ncbi:MAG: hypothetical protein WDZ35_12790 [Crocinitomicaceae bacterium]
MILLSLAGLFRTVLIILGIFFLLQLIGKMAQARRNVADHQKTGQEEEASRKRAEESKKNYGRTTISKIDKDSIHDSDYADYEEVE